MTKALILGASGHIARHVVADLSADPGIRQTLFLRNARKLHGDLSANARVVQGDVLDADALIGAVAGQDIVYANLTGDDIDAQAKAIIVAMQRASVKRLVFVLSLGIYDELPAGFQQWNSREIGEYLPPFRRSADAIEASDLDYTILRPAWLQDEDEIDYETTEKGEVFKGTEVSRRSVADLIVLLIRDPSRHIKANLGVNKPGTDGDRPSFY